MINWQAVQTIPNLQSFNASNLPVWTLWLRLQSTAHRRKITSQISQSLVAKWPFCIDPADSLGGEYTNQKGSCKERGVQRSTSSLAYLAGRQTWPWHYFRSCSTTCDASTWWQGNSPLESSRKEIRWLKYGGKLAKHLCILIVGRGSWVPRYIRATTTNICKSLSMQVVVLEFHTSMLLQLIVETANICTIHWDQNNSYENMAGKVNSFPAYRCCWNGCLGTPTHHHESPGASQPVGLRQCFWTLQLMVPQSGLF